MPLWSLLISATPVFLALLGMTWRMSGLATKLTETLETNRATTARLESRLEVLDQIPLLERDVAALKEAVAKTISMLPKLDSRLLLIEERIGSLRDWKRASLSRPDPGELK